MYFIWLFKYHMKSDGVSKGCFLVVDNDVCSMERDTGPCSDYRPVWYFEPVSRTCRRFLYGGCHGNGNNFNSSNECESRCLLGDVTPATTTVVPDVPDELVTEEPIDDREIDAESNTDNGGTFNCSASTSVKLELN